MKIGLWIVLYLAGMAFGRWVIPDTSKPVSEARQLRKELDSTRLALDRLRRGAVEHATDNIPPQNLPEE